VGFLGVACFDSVDVCDESLSRGVFGMKCAMRGGCVAEVEGKGVENAPFLWRVSFLA
jgi:hypothetical protein